YQYRAADHSGKVVEGVIEAEAENGVVSRLHEMGCVPLRIAAPGETSSKTLPISFGFFPRERVGQWELLHFTQELSTLLGAGLPLDRSLSVLTNLAEGEKLKKTVRLLFEGVRAGKALSAVMAEYPDVFPRLYINMVRAGEAGGVLESVLRHLTDYLERSLALKEDIKSALIYPLILVGTAAISLTILFVVVIPRLSVIFDDVNQALPWMTALMIGFSEGLSRYGWLVILFLVAGATAAVFYIRNPEGRLQWDRWRLNIWVLGDLLRKVEMARFARTLAALLRGGVPLLNALGTVQAVVGNVVISQAISHVQIKVKEGKGMARPLAESGVFPPLALHMLAVGEETGKLEEMLTNVANHYDQEVKQATKRFTSLLAPVLILLMAFVIGVVVISMLLGVFSIYDLPS
ncbi:MAG: type II secretion system F family protein, partial [Candidatus Binatia bacterium]